MFDLVKQGEFDFYDLEKIRKEKGKGCNWACTESLFAYKNKLMADTGYLLGIYGLAQMSDKLFKKKFKDNFEGKTFQESFTAFLFNIANAKIELAHAMSDLAITYLDNRQRIEGFVKSAEISSIDLQGSADSIAIVYKFLGPIDVNR